MQQHVALDGATMQLQQFVSLLNRHVTNSLWQLMSVLPSVTVGPGIWQAEMLLGRHLQQLTIVCSNTAKSLVDDASMHFICVRKGQIALNDTASVAILSSSVDTTLGSLILQEVANAKTAPAAAE